jgi:plasmid stability protein
MPTLYVENVPKELYEALRERAKVRRSSIAAEVIELLAQNVPTKRELLRRKKAIEQLAILRQSPSPAPGPFPSAEEILREDRAR